MALTLSCCSRSTPLTSAFQINSDRARRSIRQKVSCGVLDTIRQNLGGLGTGSKSARESRLLQAIQDTRQGQNTTPAQKADILAAVEELIELGLNEATASSPGINATWKLLWTTEKETLFILRQARRFGTEAGDVYQVIDVPGKSLNNVITFQNGAAFIVDSSLDVDPNNAQRLNFKFSGAQLKLPRRTVKLPPFGRGWFDTVWLGSKIRVAKDIRGDTLIVERDGPPRPFP